MISNSLKAKIHIGKQQLGLSEDIYRDILHVQFGVQSSKELTPSQADQLLEHFKSLGWKPRRRRRSRHSAPDKLPTLQHLTLMKHLYEALGWTESRRQMGFNEKMCGKPWPQDRAEANKIIEALKAMIKRGYSDPEARKEAE